MGYYRRLLELLNNGVKVHLHRLGKGESRWNITYMSAASFALTREMTPVSLINLWERTTELTTILSEYDTHYRLPSMRSHSVDRSELVLLSVMVSMQAVMTAGGSRVDW